MLSGLSGDAMLGEYSFLARHEYAPFANNWKPTLMMSGAVVWVEKGVFEGLDTTRGIYRRRMFTDDYSCSSSSSSSSYSASDSSSDYPQAQTFTVNLDSYHPVRY